MRAPFYIFERLEQAAVAGERCPENSRELPSSDIVALARAGKIRIEISGRNYRRVVLLTGKHAGKATAPDPDGFPPWKIIEERGTKYPKRDAGA